MRRAARFEAFVATSRFGSLDGVRCLAIVPVVFHHATPRPLPGILGRGPLGVDLFFVVSGFLITALLVRERDRRGRIDLGAFYARRALRIFPLYFAVLALYLGHALVFRAPSDPIRVHLLSSAPFYATYTANWLVRFDVPHPVAFGFAWSLSTEEQYYAVWPSILAGGAALAARVRPALSLLVPTAIAGALVAFDLAIEAGSLSELLPEGTLGRRIAASIATPIGLGSLAALALSRRAGFDAVASFLGRRLSALLAFAIVVACVAVPASPFATHLAMTALVVSVTIREDHALAPLLCARPIARLGVVSYGIYLLHVSAVTAVKAAWARMAPGSDAPTWLVFAGALAIAWAAAELSFRWFERPFLARKGRVGGGPQRR